MNALYLYIRNLGILGIALAVSVLLHVALLAVKFGSSGQFDRIFRDTPLEVVLVNANSAQAPKVAQAIAQHNLEGGGESDKKNVMAQSPAPASAMTEWGQDMELQEKQMQDMLQEQIQVLTQAKDSLSRARQYTQQEVQNDPQAAAEEKKRRALLKQLGIIEKRINEENSRPKKRFVSPATKAGSHAHYYAQFKDKVEELGTTNFPILNGRRLYGELTMIITLRSDGKIDSTELLESSGDKALDRIAQTIVKAGAPYGQFTSEMLKEYQVLVIATRFKFTRDDNLRATTQDLSTPGLAP